MKNCIACGKALPKFKQTLCSKECANFHAYELLKSKRHNLECRYCNKEYKAFRTNQKYCSKTCMGLAKRSLKGTVRECLFCGKNFKPWQKESKYCSIKCANNHKPNKVISINGCVVCGKSFEVTGLNRYGFCCSKKCCDKRYKELNPDKEHNKRARYRAKKQANAVEDVSFEYICERDNWHCQICGKLVSKIKKWPHPLSPSVDHIKPISLNGSHSHDNTQLAHLRCNVRKGASVGYQLRLTG